MKTEKKMHPIRLKTPFYQEVTGCGLHRYLDAEFVDRYKQDVQRRRFDQVQFNNWQQEERHSRHGQEPVLRLPLHRAFHIVSCEVICDRIGEPALDPEKISSAGFVIRRLRNGREQAWIVEDGEALGWQDADSELREPDLKKRLVAGGIVRKTEDASAYSGEEIYPLHSLKTKDAKGKTHTLVFGYLPLGGFYYSRESAAQLFDSDDRDKTAKAVAAALPWPYGLRTPYKKVWLEDFAKPIKSGMPSKAFFELLRLWVTRYHLGETGIEENDELEQLAAQLWFYDETMFPAGLRNQSYNAASEHLYTPYRKQSLLAYLKACFSQPDENPLVVWIAQQEKEINKVGSLDNLNQFDPLPNSNGKDSMRLSLLMLEGQAATLRDLLGKRYAEQTLQNVKEIPLPKFTQNASDLYQVVPFVRCKNECGCEIVYWADTEVRSIAFRVAAPFDPEASRPAVIQMPSLDDLRRGLAKGAAMITPPDTFDLMNKLKLNKGASEDAVPEDSSGDGLGLQWICSFSLPVITLVAMILLMIMISLLNILFFWLPWVRICLPFPKMKGGG